MYPNKHLNHCLCNMCPNTTVIFSTASLVGFIHIFMCASIDCLCLIGRLAVECESRVSRFSQTNNIQLLIDHIQWYRLQSKHERNRMCTLTGFCTEAFFCPANPEMGKGCRFIMTYDRETRLWQHFTGGGRGIWLLTTCQLGFIIYVWVCFVFLL